MNLSGTRQSGGWKGQTVLYGTGAINSFWGHLEERMRALGHTPLFVGEVMTAVHEGLWNAFEHGNRRDPDLPITVRFRVETDGIALEIADAGDGFNPQRVPDPTSRRRRTRERGRGIAIMEGLMERVTFSRSGNRVIMYRSVSWVPPVRRQLAIVEE